MDGFEPTYWSKLGGLLIGNRLSAMTESDANNLPIVLNNLGKLALTGKRNPESARQQPMKFVDLRIQVKLICD